DLADDAQTVACEQVELGHLAAGVRDVEREGAAGRLGRRDRAAVVRGLDRESRGVAGVGGVVVGDAAGQGQRGRAYGRDGCGGADESHADAPWCCADEEVEGAPAVRDGSSPRTKIVPTMPR